MNFQEKEQSVAEMKAQFTGAAASFLVQYQGCSCTELTQLRKDLRPSGARFAVIKNTLAKLAVADTDAAALNEAFDGPTAVVWSESDPVTPAKVLTKFAKDQESFAIKAGLVDGRFIDVKEIETLAQLPSREEVLAKLLALINAPATQLLQMVNAPASSLVRLLGAWQSELEKKES